MSVKAGCRRHCEDLDAASADDGDSQKSGSADGGDCYCHRCGTCRPMTVGGGRRKEMKRMGQRDVLVISIVSSPEMTRMKEWQPRLKETCTRRGH